LIALHADDAADQKQGKNAQGMDAHTGLPILAMTELIAQLSAIGVVTKSEYLANSVL